MSADATAGEDPTPVDMHGSLTAVRERLMDDPDFSMLVLGEAEEPTDGDPSLLVGAVAGIRPALEAAVARRSPVIAVTASGRDAEELVDDVRSWYDGDPHEVALLESWETLPHERLSPRADTVANRMAVFRRLCHPVAGDPMFGPIRVLVMPVRSLIQPVVAGLGDVRPLVFRQGEELDLEDAVRALVHNAYTRVDLVMD
ncbi:MAG: transcription-repair coupling factor, partial [Bifidobacterium sp.]|nr:transcription-repair coupling factor [Bifidobacterium sp.]